MSTNEELGQEQVWFVTGCSRGIGKEILSAALAHGARVVATARNPARVAEAFPNTEGRVLPLQLDVDDARQADRAVDQALKEFGRIDVLVNNAGYGQLGHFETVSAQDVEQQFRTNVFGLMHVTRAVLPAMREQRSGRIVNLSSIGGAVGFDGASLYCATKFAVEGFSESLALELRRFGIHVTIVEPGFFRTDFLDSSSVRYGESERGEYEEAARAQQSQYGAYSHEQPGDPRRLAELIVDVCARGDSPPLRLIAGSDALSMSRELLTRRSAEAEAWAPRSVTTDFPS